MRDVAVVSFAQAPNKRRELERNEVEILMPVVSSLYTGPTASPPNGRKRLTRT